MNRKEFALSVIRKTVSLSKEADRVVRGVWSRMIQDMGDQNPSYSGALNHIILEYAELIKRHRGGGK